MDYTSLITQIQNYANKADSDVAFKAATASFIQMGQQRIWRELTGVEFEKRIVTDTLKTGNAYIEKPEDWNKTISLLYGTSSNFSNQANVLSLRTYEFCRSYWQDANNTDANNPPLFYSEHIDSNNQQAFFISPTPDQDYRYELTYLKRVDLITNSNSNNVLTDNYPDLLFYACFLEALGYLRDDERIGVFEQNYQRALTSAQEKTMVRHTDRTSNRDID